MSYKQRFKQINYYELFRFKITPVWQEPYSWQLSSRIGMELEFHTGPARKLSTNLYDIHHCWVYSEWTPDDGQTNCHETCRVSWQNKFVKLVHLVGFITKETLQYVFKYMCHLWDLRFLWQWLWILLCCGMWYCVILPNYIVIPGNGTLRCFNCEINCCKNRHFHRMALTLFLDITNFSLQQYVQYLFKFSLHC
jgi:hypothetical protein